MTVQLLRELCFVESNMNSNRPKEKKANKKAKRFAFLARKEAKEKENQQVQVVNRLYFSVNY